MHLESSLGVRWSTVGRRLYTAKQEVLDGKWSPPPVQKVSCQARQGSRLTYACITKRLAWRSIPEMRRRLSSIRSPFPSENTHAATASISELHAEG